MIGWQFPIFLTLMLTGVQPGELCHLLVEDIDLRQGILRVRNKPELGWQVKTRAERVVPLVPVLSDLLSNQLNGIATGPVFRRRKCVGNASASGGQMRGMVDALLLSRQQELSRALSRKETLAAAKSVWWAVGAIKEDGVRTTFIEVCKRIRLPLQTMPKVLRHGFATALQDANVDPLIRCQLMGHVADAIGDRRAGAGLGMTAVYTHSRPETIRKQLEHAMAIRPATLAAIARLSLRDGGVLAEL